MATYTLTTGNDTLTGTAGDDLFSGPMGGVDNLSGDGGNDVFDLIGAPSFSMQISIDGGDGIDVLKVESGWLDQVSFSKIERIETFGFLSCTVAQLQDIRSVGLQEINGGYFMLRLNGGGGIIHLDDAKFDANLPWNTVDLSYLTSGANVSLPDVNGFIALTGTFFDDTIRGGSGNDYIMDETGRDYVMGAGGNDTIEFEQDNTADTAIGGAGDDLYLNPQAMDVIREGAGGGTDTIELESNAWQLGANLENLSFTGTGNFAGLGNGLANTITGAGGDDLLKGFGGDDWLIGRAGADTLIGGAGDDVLRGGAGPTASPAASATTRSCSARIASPTPSPTSHPAAT